MPRFGKYIAVIWDSSLVRNSNLSTKMEEIGLTLHEVDGINGVLETKFNSTPLFFYIVDKFNGRFELVGDLKRKYHSRKFICIDMLGYSSLEKICDENNIIYLRKKFDPVGLEDFVVAQCFDVLEKHNNPDHVEQSDLYQVRKLAERIDAAAGAIQELRLNSTGQIIEELFNISREIRSMRTDISVSFTERDISVKGETKNALKAIGGIFDAIEHSGLAAIVVSGAVTAVVGCGGWSAVACQTICLASWHGKDALMTAINKLPGPKSKQRVPKVQEKI